MSTTKAKGKTNAKTYKPGDAKVEALFFKHPTHLSPVRNRDKKYSEGPIEVDEGIMSNDYSFLLFKGATADTLTRIAPETVDNYGRVSGNGVRSNFYGLRYVSGYPMLPATFPMVDNTELRAAENLVSDWVEPWHKVCARALTRLFFSGIEPVPMKIRTNSSSMMPYYTKDLAAKLNLARRALDAGERAGTLMLKGDYVTPWTEWAIGGAYHTVYREQASDKVTKDEKGNYHPKDRNKADLLYAISGGREGTFSPADRSLAGADFKAPEGFFRTRNRTAMGGPLGLNANLMIIAQAVRAHIYKEFAYTFHHTTRLSQQEDMRKMGMQIAADVSNHDWYWPTWVIETIADELLALGYAEWWVAMYRVRMKLPNYVTSVGPDLGNILLGDWTNPSNSGGLPSGNAFTDLDGSWLMTLVYFIMQVTHTYPELIKQLQTDESAEAVLRSYLKGELPIRLKDKSDDAVLGFQGGHIEARAHKLLQKMKDGESVSPYMSISYEHGGAFLGSIQLYPTDKDSSKLVLIGNINSLTNNMFSPEYGIQSALRDRSKAKRPYPFLGWKTLSQNYGTAPMYRDVLDVIEFQWSKVYGESFAMRREKLMIRDERRLLEDTSRMNLKTPELDPISIEVMMDPSKLDWKYDRNDVDPSIAALLFNGLPLEEVEPYFKRIYKS